MTQDALYPQYKVADIDNYKYYNYLKCLVSELPKYLATQAAILVSTILYYIFTAPYSPTALFVLSIIFHILTFTTLLILAYKDPGILPKILPSFESPHLTHIPIDKRYITCQAADFQKVFILTAKTHLLKFKFCTMCFIYRPPRASHCYTCNICVERFDHHCPWIGTCVGKRNYVCFFAFLVSLALLVLFIWIQNFIVVTTKKDQVSVGAFVINIILIIVIFMTVCFVYVLLGFHIYFSLNNITTNQFCKNAWQSISGNPFSKKGFMKNISKIFVAQNYPKKINPKSFNVERNASKTSQEQNLRKIQTQSKEKSKSGTHNKSRLEHQNQQTQRSVQFKVIEGQEIKGVQQKIH